ncbi:hypothetical protein [Planktothrix sp. FACHB-1365]|uniref:hypothetical protein n=1 Tax=Planktothrix sp. FACHB-1365 TaxID=2692855 RepID=UPI001685C4FC|nr:hypothetical protein [Planktothrix sp. FACHB-1365]MBD2483511.1 hypothetical protein [Planktothrix sp. FACHB-1365]
MENITNSFNDISVILDELEITVYPSDMVNSSNGNMQENSSSSTAVVNDIGAGGESEATATSPTGEVQYSSESVFTPGATSSEASAIAISSTDTSPTTEATVVTTSQTDNSPLTPIINPDNNSSSSSSISIQISPEPNYLTVIPSETERIPQLGSMENDLLIGTHENEAICGFTGADVFVLSPNPNFPNSNPNLADIIIDFNLEGGDKIGLSENLIAQPLILETFDSNADGSLDATIIKLGSNSQSEVLGSVLGTVSAHGQTTLTPAHFTVISQNMLMLD